MARPDVSRRRKAYRLGFLAEWIAAGFLLIKGYRILALRYSAHSGEIDIIAMRRDVVAFVEVKARASRGRFDGYQPGKATPLRARRASLGRTKSVVHEPDIALRCHHCPSHAPPVSSRGCISALNGLESSELCETGQRREAFICSGPDGPDRSHQHHRRFDLRPDA